MDDIFSDEYNDTKQVLSLVTIRNKHDSNGGTLPSVIEELSLLLFSNIEHAPRIVSSFHCNGLICLVTDIYSPHGETIVFCNPALREFRIIPVPSYLPDFGCMVYIYGFGFDSIANDYKYVWVLRSLKDRNEFRAQVYTLRTDSWNDIKIDIKLRFRLYVRKVVYCRDWKSLTVWNESVALFLSRENSWYSTSFEMWVMVDNFGGVKDCTSWNKHLTIGPLVCIHSPVAFWKTDELLMETRDGQIVSYNLHTQKLFRIPITGAVVPGQSHAVSYLKSLVSVKGGNMLNH
ncbi:F-box associated interaction domain containing protein [Parasponia andersonii]|uniref:F-box associated interaction domain containing protein n=1 Tax=Parasponia andersonii TaxID=3476 RepID=A0A2P5BZC2_PARAD|nr:F-box associated interaction domain containing protein [Parasponia andersonii]